MPKLVKEISEGVGYSYSSEQGQVAEAQPRVFRVILSFSGELFDIQAICGVRIGDELRPGAKIYCTAFDARFEGASRLVLICTFQFRSTADAASSGGGPDPKSFSPEVRPPNWTTATSLIEQPLFTWRKRQGQVAWGNDGPAVNPAGDIYDGVSRLVPVVTVSIETWAAIDPTRDNQFAGMVNSVPNRLGTLAMNPHTLMFRGVQCQPAVESWGGLTHRGWKATYEFMYKKNETKVRVGGADLLVDLGWDVAIPQSGFNVKAFAMPAAEDQESFGQPLRHSDGRIVPPLLLPETVAVGDKVRAMVKVCDYQDGGVSQSPSASPIPLNDDGSPRKDTADPKVLVYGYAVQPEMNFAILNGGKPLIQ